MIAAGSVALICGIAWAVIYFMGAANSSTGKAAAGAVAVLESEGGTPKPQTISSELGMNVTYNTRELEGYGFAEDVTFSGNDLDETRPYSIMRVRPVATSEANRSEITLASPELRITSSLNASYWELLAAKKDYKDLSKIDQLVKETTASKLTDKTIEATDVEAQKIGEYDYRKVSYVSTNELYGVTTERREDCYMTVQSDRPYVACINNIRPSNFSVVPQLEQALKGISYSKVDTDILEKEVDEKQDEAMLNGGADEEVESADMGDATDEESVDTGEGDDANKREDGDAKPKVDTDTSTAVPAYLTDEKDFTAAATVAPATVRVGTLYCADIQLTLPMGGSGPTLTGACVDKAGTGFVISGSGLVATSASVVQIKPAEAIASYVVNAPTPSVMSQRLERVLEYLVQSRIIMQSDADAIVAGVAERNQDVIAKVNELSTKINPEDIAIKKESYSYAVQLSNTPIVVNDSGDGSSSFTYTDSVVSAKLETQSYSSKVTQTDIYQGKPVEDDTALLQLETNARYPAVSLGLSGESLAEKSSVSISGMPMYAFGSIASAQLRSTPMYRSGAISQVFNVGSGVRVWSVATVSHAGFAGAPVVDQRGRVVGVATYNNLNCPDRKCFASTVVRDTSGVSELVKQRNISLQTSTASMQAWQQGLAQMNRGNFKGATAQFEEAARLYPFNHHAAAFAAYSKSQYGSATDTSTINTVSRLLGVTVVAMAGLLLLLAIVLIGTKIFIRPRAQTQYGNMAGGEYIDPNQWRQTAPPQTLAPLPQPQQSNAWQQVSPSQTPQSNYPQSQTNPSSPYAPPQTPSSAPYQQAPQPSNYRQEQQLVNTQWGSNGESPQQPTSSQPPQTAPPQSNDWPNQGAQ